MRSTTTTTLLLLLSILLASIISMATGCPAPKDNPKGLQMTQSEAPIFTEADTHISLKAGEEFILKLNSNPTTGYTWMLKEDKVPENLNFLGCKYERAPHPDGIVGSGGADSWGFKAASAGQVILELQKVRPWISPRPKQMDASIIVTIE